MNVGFPTFLKNVGNLAILGLQTLIATASWRCTGSASFRWADTFHNPHHSLLSYTQRALLICFRTVSWRYLSLSAIPRPSDRKAHLLASSCWIKSPSSWNKVLDSSWKETLLRKNETLIYKYMILLGFEFRSFCFQSPNVFHYIMKKKVLWNKAEGNVFVFVFLKRRDYWFHLQIFNFTYEKRISNDHLSKDWVDCHCLLVSCLSYPNLPLDNQIIMHCTDIFYYFS